MGVAGDPMFNNSCEGTAMTVFFCREVGKMYICTCPLLHLVDETRTEREGRKRKRESEREICGMFAESAQQINDLFA